MVKIKTLAVAALSACMALYGLGCVGMAAQSPAATIVIDVEPTPATLAMGGIIPERTETPGRPTPDPNVGRPPEPTPEATPVPDETAAPFPTFAVDPEKPMVALTFDDGPSKKTTRILDVLEQHGARATFFVVGTQLEAYPEITQRAAAMGCEIGNHTYSHQNLTEISVDEIRTQIDSVNELVKQTTGRDIVLVRPPYGAGIKDETVTSTVEYPLIMWTIDTLDWSTRDTDSTLEAIRKDIRDGSIVLMHDLYDPTAAAVEIIVPELVGQGYQLVTVSELFTAKEISLVPGKYYRRAFDLD